MAAKARGSYVVSAPVSRVWGSRPTAFYGGCVAPVAYSLLSSSTCIVVEEAISRHKYEGEIMLKFK